MQWTMDKVGGANSNNSPTQNFIIRVDKTLGRSLNQSNLSAIPMTPSGSFKSPVFPGQSLQKHNAQQLNPYVRQGEGKGQLLSLNLDRQSDSDTTARRISSQETSFEETNRLQQGAAPGTNTSDGLTLEEKASVYLSTGAGNRETSLNFGSSRMTLYLVDVHPLCYEGKKPRPTAILNWMKLLFRDVSHADPVVAVMDGEKGNEYRRSLLPTYKSKRNTYKPLSGVHGHYFRGDEVDLREAFPHIQNFLMGCNVPVLKIEDAEADDVIATLAQQGINKGMRVVVASPDMDFRQLLSENVNMLLPLPEFGRWSFYTLKQYIAEHDCEPSSDLGLRCMLGDLSDSVPGLPEWAPGFGRKTALKLMKKHGSLENLLLAAQSRTVGKPYIQEALVQHRDALYRNLQVLSFRRDIDITLKEEWCRPRSRSNEAESFRRLQEYLKEKRYNSCR